jgi:hypothetical protein
VRWLHSITPIFSDWVHLRLVAPSLYASTCMRKSFRRCSISSFLLCCYISTFSFTITGGSFLPSSTLLHLLLPLPYPTFLKLDGRFVASSLSLARATALLCLPLLHDSQAALTQTKNQSFPPGLCPIDYTPYHISILLTPIRRNPTRVTVQRKSKLWNWLDRKQRKQPAI